MDVGPRQAYRCRSLRAGAGGGGHVRRSAPALDAFVGEVIITRLSRPDARDLVYPRTPATPTIDIDALRTREASLRAIRDRYAAYMGRGECPDDMDPAEFAIARKANRAALEAAQAQLAVTVDTTATTPLLDAEDVRVAWDTLPLGAQRAVVTELMTVTVLPVTRRGAGFDPQAVKIEWRQ